jgi:hypothetical protein
MEHVLERKIRGLLVLVIVGLVVSGLTAIPIQAELVWLTRALGAGPDAQPENASGILRWLLEARDAVSATSERYPFLLYGTDWLAFGHFAIAFAFVGPLRDPLKNSWVITFGLVASGGVIVWAMLMGPLRGVPLSWRVIDCLFGVGAAVPLLLCRRYIRRLERPSTAGR